MACPSVEAAASVRPRWPTRRADGRHRCVSPNISSPGRGKVARVAGEEMPSFFFPHSLDSALRGAEQCGEEKESPLGVQGRICCHRPRHPRFEPPARPSVDPLDLDSPASGRVAAGVVHDLECPRKLETRPALEDPRPPGLRALSRAGASEAGSRRGRGQDGTRDRLRPIHPTAAPAARRTSCGHDRSARSAPLAISFRPTTIGIMELRRDGSGSQGLRIGGGCTVTETPDGSDVQLAAASSMHRAFGTAPSARTAMQAVTLHGGPRAWSRRVAPRPPRRAGHRRHTGSTPAAHGSGPSVNPHGGQKGA